MSKKSKLKKKRVVKLPKLPNSVRFLIDRWLKPAGLIGVWDGEKVLIFDDRGVEIATWTKVNGRLWTKSGGVHCVTDYLQIVYLLGRQLPERSQPSVLVAEDIPY